nr:hypothetical protein [Tanacetum cinerariifolium]
VRESKSYTMILQDKIEELEKKLKVNIADSSSSMKTTPREADKHILRSSNIMNRQTVASLNRSKRNDSLGSIGAIDEKE